MKITSSEGDHSARRDPVLKAFQTLHYLAAESTPDHSVRIRALARHLGVSPSSASRVVSNLESAGVIEKDPASVGYIFTQPFVRTARRIGDSNGYTRAVYEALLELAWRTSETSLFAEYDPVTHGLSFTQMIESVQPVRFVARLHETLPVYLGASGLAVMSLLEGRDLSYAIDAAAAAIEKGDMPWKNVGELEQALASARAAGYTTTSGHRVPDATGIFAPIRDANRLGIGAVGLMLPTQRLHKGEASEFGKLVKEASAKIQKSLGAV